MSINTELKKSDTESDFYFTDFMATWYKLAEED